MSLAEPDGRGNPGPPAEPVTEKVVFAPGCVLAYELYRLGLEPKFEGDE